MCTIRAAISSLVNRGDVFRRFRRDESGSYLITATLLMPVLVGIVGLGTDAGLWMYKHRAMQSAADSGAYSAATAYVKGTEQGLTITVAEMEAQARAVAATYGFSHGAGEVDVTVNWPYGGDQQKVEVIVAQPQITFFFGAFRKLSSSEESGSVVVRARALAAGTPGVPSTEGTPGTAGNGCVLALNKSASGSIATQGTSDVALSNCTMFANSNSSTALTAGGSSTISAIAVGVVGGISGVSRITTPDAKNIKTGIAAIGDPYAGVPDPVFSNGNWTLPGRSSDVACDLTAYNPAKNPPPIIGPTDPDHKLFVICNGMTINAGVTLTLRPGIYIFDRGLVQINGNASVVCPNCVNGAGVTLVFTSSTGTNFATLVINGGAIVSLAAPSSGPTKGLVIYGDRRMPLGTVFQLNGGSTQTLNGAVYVPRGSTLFAGGSQTSNACTQLVSDTITFTGNAQFKIGCSNGTEAIGSTQGTPGTPGTPETVLLVE